MSKLTLERKQIVREAHLQPMYVKRVGHQLVRVFDADQIDAIIEQKAVQQLRNDAEYFTSAEFRQEVIEELMANGANELQATNRTRDQARLFNEARELGLM